MVKMALQDVVISPLVSEKSSQMAALGKYCFRIHPMANKPMVKKALETFFDVKIRTVAVTNTKGNFRKTRTKKGLVSRYTPLKKKAIVSLKEGSFPFFENIQ